MLPRIKRHSAAHSEKKKQFLCIEENLPAFRTALTRWFRKEGRDLPWRHTKDPYAILVSEIMLQQTQVATVIGYYQRWMERFPTAAALAAAPEPAVLELWQGLGYYSRARNLHRAAQRLVEEHGGQFPREAAALRTLPGVGRYTAAAVATFAFDQPLPPVDGNIARVLARLLNFCDPVDTAAGLEHLWETATRWQPRRRAGFYNEAMMELGALVCTPRAPLCHTCPVARFCAAPEPERLPLKKPRPKTIALTERCGWTLQGGKLLLEHQTGTRWKGLWKLPLLSETDATPAGEGRNRSEAKSAPLLSLQYPFTHHRITLEVYPATPEPLSPAHQWHPLASLTRLPITAPHRRAIRQLLKEQVGP